MTLIPSLCSKFLFQDKFNVGLRYIRNLEFQCAAGYLSFVITCEVMSDLFVECLHYFLDARLSKHSKDRVFMELPRYEWRKKDAGPIRDWWKHRIQNLCLNGEYQNADALFREFDLSDD